MNTTSIRDRRALSGRESAGITLRHAGAAQMAGTLHHDTGEMTWTTDTVGDAEPAGTFAVVDGVLLVAYRHADTDWLRIGTHTHPRAEVEVTLEVGLSARELLLVTSGSTVRLRADGDPAAEVFAAELLVDDRAA